MFVNLQGLRRAPRSERCRATRSPTNLRHGVRQADPRGARCAVFGPPPVRGVGRAGGFTIMVEDRGDVGPASPADSRPRTWSAPGNETPGLVGAVLRVPRQRAAVHIDPDLRRVHGQGRRRCRTSPTRWPIYQGSLYVNDFNLFGRTWQVIVQADPQFRDQVEDLIPAEGPQQPAGRWCRSARWPAISADQRAAGADALQHVPGRLDQRHGRRRASAPARRSTCMQQLADARAAAEHDLRMDRHVLPGAAWPATRP